LTPLDEKYPLKEITWFRETYDFLYENIRNYTYFKTGDVNIAEEVTEDTFVRLWSLRKNVRPQATKSLLYSLAKNIIKKKQKNSRVVFHFVREIVWDEQTESTDSPLINDEIFKKLQKLIADIPQLPRVIFLMNQIEGLTKREISDRLNLKISAIDMFVDEAKEMLRSGLRLKEMNGNNCTEIESRGDFDDRLLKIFSGLKVPPADSLKEEVWQKLTERIERIDRSLRLKVKLMHLGALLLLFIVILSVIFDWHFAMKTVEAPAGKIAYGQLPDSTVTTLNAGSVIKHREYGFKKSRTVFLEGEAYFDVKKSNIDFRLILGVDTLWVKEARFNVFFRSGILKVECLSGEIYSSIKSFNRKVIPAGQGIMITPESNFPFIFYLNVETAASWLRGNFFYTKTPP
jgi:RNA polymerase sigma-70 factor (ECF subfamily)